jgi:hypothetical protein
VKLATSARTGERVAALCLLLLLAGLAPLAAQAPAEPPPGWDFDTLFDAPPEEGPAEGGPGSAGAAGDSGAAGAAGDSGEAAGGGPLAGLTRRTGASLDFSYSANGGFAPGWDESPWFAADHPPEYSSVIGANLYSYLGMDVQVSDVFRARGSLALTAPGGSAIAVDELFLDYRLLERVFFRVGKFGQSWGISRAFPIANLPGRVPARQGGDPYIFKADVPIGVGGLQLLALTRSGFMRGSTPGFDELGYGGKYNLAFTWADIDLGVFYYAEMPLRGSVSVKATIKNTELYAEAVGAVEHKTWDGFHVSASLGAARSFAGGLFVANGEILWNGEDGAFYFVPKTELKDAENSPFIPGLNLALNLAFRPGWRGNLRFALGSRWALDTDTAYLIPGLSFSPFRHVDVSLGFPLALGGRDGRYYRDNADRNGRPVGVALLVNLHGSYRLDSRAARAAK